MTVIDIPVAFSPNNAAKNPPTPPPIKPMINGFIYLKFTPYIAGSVIPSVADNTEGYASAFVLADFVFIATPSAAPACAIIDAELIGFTVFQFVEASI